MHRLQREKEALLSHVQSTEYGIELKHDKDREYESIINELRVSEALAKQQLQYMNEIQSNHVNSDFKEQFNQLEVEKKHFEECYEKSQRNIQRKELENEELSKMQMSLLLKIKQLETEMNENNELFNIMKSRNKELELNNEVLIDDNETIRKKMVYKNEELLNLQESNTFNSKSSSKLYTIEPG